MARKWWFGQVPFEQGWFADNRTTFGIEFERTAVEICQDNSPTFSVVACSSGAFSIQEQTRCGLGCSM